MDKNNESAASMPHGSHARTSSLCNPVPSIRERTCALLTNLLLSFLIASSASACFWNDEEVVVPTIETIWLEGVSGNTAQPNSFVHAKVTGRGIIGEVIIVEVFGEFESADEILLLQSWEETVVYRNYYQRVDVDFHITGDVLDREDRVRIYFRALFRDQVIVSDSLYLDVEAQLQAARVFYEGPSGPAECGEGAPYPADQELTVLVESMGLVGRTLIVEVLHHDDVETTLDTLEVLIESQTQEITYQLDTEAFDNDGPVPISFEVMADDFVIRSPLVVASDSGIHSCGWYTTLGDQLGSEAEVAVRTTLNLRAYAWGLDDMEAFFNIWDDDEASGDDFVVGVASRVENGLAAADWLVLGTGDGLFNSDNEYYLYVQIGEQTCGSSRIITVND